MIPIQFPVTIEQVSEWLGSLGYDVYQETFRSNDVTGEVLLRADHYLLKELGVVSVGHRIHMLRAIYTLKINLGIPFEDGDYVYDEISDTSGSLEQMKIKVVIHQQNNVIQKLNTDIEGLSAELGKLKDELSPIWEFLKDYQDVEQKGLSNQGTLKGKLFSIPSAAKDMVKRSNTTGAPAQTLSAMRVYTDSKLNRENEPYKTVQLSYQDTIVEIIPEVLRKYKIQDDWQNYALVMRDRAAKVERSLGMDEKPLRILQDNRNARFVLKHLKLVPPPTLQRVGDLAAATGAGNIEGSPAVAVYEYNATLPDELNVMIGDRFNIISRREGWCVATTVTSSQEKDGKTGWVPAGCLRELENIEMGTLAAQSYATIDSKRSSNSMLDSSD
ncbi:hypothetical protein DFJ77DRAFT_506344 [Powellomyces hirtus]|nr:hypothetical protein DFJ77DRAFT_506344 [Powellomyces hirtus]